MKKTVSLILAVLLLSACGKREPGPPPDLTGHWIQSGSAGTYYQVATITENSIEVFWHLTADGSEYLYWSGTFTPPETDEEPYTWTSELNYDRAKTSTRARRESTLTFTYEKGKISYIQIQGRLHFNVKLERMT